MVKIAIAGGFGELGREITDELVNTGKHDITILTRKASGSRDAETRKLRHQEVDYDDHESLVQALDGIHTVLSFVNQSMEAPEKNCQIRLIDACISVGVKRFAPSEYGSVGKDDLPFWSKKKYVKDYLEKVNKSEKVLEYTLFQPGTFMNYLASPFKTSKYVTPLDYFIDMQNRRAIVVEGHEDAIMTLTTVQDIVGVVTRAVDYEGEWPESGGIRGNMVTAQQVIEIGEKVRGSPFSITKVKKEDLEAGVLKTPWGLGKRHPGFTHEAATQLEAMLKTVLVGTLLSTVKGAWAVPDDWNRLLPDYKFTKLEDFLTEAWEGKP